MAFIAVGSPAARYRRAVIGLLCCALAVAGCTGIQPSTGQTVGPDNPAGLWRQGGNG